MTTFLSPGITIEQLQSKVKAPSALDAANAMIAARLKRYDFRPMIQVRRLIHTCGSASSRFMPEPKNLQQCLGE
ncbi:hypothetical protein LP414_05585 [Polaromonas sp. P1(28)-13]|nr:hypothetical protein LP414_05585 [Polaromonas sp. P1(28)-13]